MTGEELKSALAALKLSQMDFAHMLAVQRTTVSRWATDKVAVPVHVVFILRMLRLVGIPIWMMPPERKPGRKPGVPQIRKKRRKRTKRTVRE